MAEAVRARDELLGSLHLMPSLAVHACGAGGLVADADALDDLFDTSRSSSSACSSVALTPALGLGGAVAGPLQHEGTSTSRVQCDMQSDGYG